MQLIEQYSFRWCQQVSNIILYYFFGAVGRAMDLRFTGHGFKSWLDTSALWPWASYLHLCGVYLCHQALGSYNLVLANRGDLFGWESHRGPGGK